jgi:2,3-diketo-5-methylthio-1-phosphopentane phosphatase
MPKNRWTILCDFDGTIARVDVIDRLLERHGLAGWEDLENRWKAGKIGSRECMQGQVALLDMSVAELDALLDEVAIDPAFSAFVDRALALGHAVQVVSDGMDYAIRRILSRHGLGWLSVAANRLIQTGPRRWELSSPHRQEGCPAGTCKCGIATAARRGTPCPVLLIGDGRSDFCAAESVDHVFAKSSLLTHCRTLRLSHSPVAGFDDVLALLPDLQRYVQPLAPVAVAVATA